jgi:hypothetical protein
MGWTVIKINESGKEEKKLSTEFEINNWDNLDLKQFRVAKYLDPYGDMTVNSRQFDDLKFDLRTIDNLGLTNQKILEELLKLIEDCKKEPHSYLKFYGD